MNWLILFLARLGYRAQRTLNGILGRAKTTYVWERVPYYEGMWRAAAERCDLEFAPLSGSIWELRHQGGEPAMRVSTWISELDNPVTLHVAGDKAMTYRLLDAAGLATVPHAIFSPADLGPLRDFVRTHPGPFVVKPASGTGSGIGVTTHIEGYRGCVRAAALASLYGSELLVEQFVPGEVSRLLFLGGDLLTASCRRGVRVAGDGTRTLRQLVEDEYAAHEGLGGIPDWRGDRDLRVTTEMQGLQPTSVPAAGERILVKSVAQGYRDVVEIRTVYTHDVTHEVCDELVEEARRAAAVVRSELCGVDVITMDLGVPLGEGQGVIGEINTTPGLHHHYDLVDEDSRAPVADSVIRHVLAADRKSWCEPSVRPVAPHQ